MCLIIPQEMWNTSHHFFYDNQGIDGYEKNFFLTLLTFFWKPYVYFYNCWIYIGALIWLFQKIDI